MQEESTRWVVNIYLQVRFVSSSERRARRLLLCVLGRLLAELLGLFRLLRKDLLDLCMRRKGVSVRRLEGKGRT